MNANTMKELAETVINAYNWSVFNNAAEINIKYNEYEGDKELSIISNIKCLADDTEKKVVASIYRINNAVGYSIVTHRRDTFSGLITTEDINAMFSDEAAVCTAVTAVNMVMIQFATECMTVYNATNNKEELRLVEDKPATKRIRKKKQS